VLALPARALLTFTHDFLFVMLSAPTLKGLDTRGVAETTTVRLAYLLRRFECLAAEPYGVDAEDAIGAVRDVDPDGAHFARLLAYSHACQVMPEVWRGYFNVAATESGLHLTHRDDAFAEAEARDILISEIGLNFRFNAVRHAPDRDVAALARGLPRVDFGFLALVVAKKAARFRTEIVEPQLISDAALQQILGFDHEAFKRIQAAFNGLAETALEMSLFLTAWWQHDHPGVNEMPTEAVEWCSVNLPPETVVELIAATAGVTEDQVESLIDAFCIDYRQTPPQSQGGDGFFPPFARFEGALLFSPVLLQVFLSTRNAIYGFAKSSRELVEAQIAQGEPVTDLFGSLVANDLEPHLVQQAIATLPPHAAWVILDGVSIPGGEIDLVIVDPISAVALCIQAKAPLPPLGARLTERLAERCEEGLQQIAAFSALPLATQRAAIATATGVNPEGLKIHHGLLARTCFGSADAWAAWPQISLMTLATVALASRQHAEAASPDLETFITRLQLVIENYVAGTSFKWEPGQISIGDHTLDLPLLKFDEAFVKSTREQACLEDRQAEPPLPDVVDFLSPNLA